MSEKKVVSTRLAFALGIGCIALLVGLAEVMAYYTATIINKNVTYDSYVSSHSHTNSEFDIIRSTFKYYMETYSHRNSEYDSYVANHTHTNSEYNSLQNQVNNLTAPQVVSVNLQADDNRTIPATPFLHVHGYIVNFGTNTAYGWQIYVGAYQDGVVANETIILLPGISGRSWITVDSSLYYNGSALTSWNLRLSPIVIIGG